jgi:hypothetical protein
MLKMQNRYNKTVKDRYFDDAKSSMGAKSIKS